MDQLNQDTASSPQPPPPPAAAAPNELLAKRKRGRPRKEETSQVNSQSDNDLVGQMVTGVVEGSFDAGYLLNVKVKDSDKKLRGLVFKPGKVTPVTPENDVAPLAKMYGREEIKNQTDQSLPNDQPMKDVVTDSEISESSRALPLVPPQESNGETVQAKEAVIEKDGVMEEEKEDEEATRLVEFFPTPETMMTAQPQPMVQKETEQQKSPGETTRGFDLLVAEKEKPVCPGEKVPEMLQLELGNKTTLSGDNNSNNNIVTTETTPEASVSTNPETSVSKSGFIANLFEGEDKKEDCNMEEEEEATPSVK